eukprot:XP_019926493.1 PREDICTED: uncharacterized protein LOC109619842 isoform X2 [Crassostrea gigas]
MWELLLISLSQNTVHASYIDSENLKNFFKRRSMGVGDFQVAKQALIRTKTTMMMGFNERFLSCTENRKHQRRLGIQSHKMAAHEL